MVVLTESTDDMMGRYPLAQMISWASSQMTERGLSISSVPYHLKSFSTSQTHKSPCSWQNMVRSRSGKVDLKALLGRMRRAMLPGGATTKVRPTTSVLHPTVVNITIPSNDSSGDKLPRLPAWLIHKFLGRSGRDRASQHGKTSSRRCNGISY